MVFRRAIRCPFMPKHGISNGFLQPSLPSKLRKRLRVSHVMLKSLGSLWVTENLPKSIAKLSTCQVFGIILGVILELLAAPNINLFFHFFKSHFFALRNRSKKEVDLGTRRILSCFLIFCAFQTDFNRPASPQNSVKREAFPTSFSVFGIILGARKPSKIYPKTF